MRRVVWLTVAGVIGVIGVMVAVVVTLVVAQGIRAAFDGNAPIDFNSWLIAFVALVGLAASRAVPGPKQAARPAQRGGLRAAVHSGSMRARAALAGALSGPPA